LFIFINDKAYTSARVEILSPVRGNPFSDPRIREARLRNYKVAHVARLAVHRQFSDMAEETAAIHGHRQGGRLGVRLPAPEFFRFPTLSDF